MESRLQAVLRVGEAHRQTVSTGALEVSDLSDDVLRQITQAIGNGNKEAACRAARRWCDLVPRHRAMCRDGGAELWNELTTRVFGANSIGVADATDAQKNFYELCRRAVGREAALKWMRKQHPHWNVTEVDVGYFFLLRLVDVLELLDNGGRETPEKRVRLVGMLQWLFQQKPAVFTNTDLLDLFSLESLYRMVASKQTEEIDAALELLKRLADDTDVFHEDNQEDNREGYLPDKVPLLKRLLLNNPTQQRAENILSLWDGLMFTGFDTVDEDRTDDQGRYARALLRWDVEVLLMDYVQAHDNPTVRRFSAAVMKNIAHCLNASLTRAMYDSSGPHGHGTSGLVYGTD